MEARWRKLLTTKRGKTGAPAANRDLHGLSYDETGSQTRPPIFVHHAPGKSETERGRKSSSDGLAVRAVAYHDVVAKKAPHMGARPQKGNGPVKLQTNRRLSTGELIATPQDEKQVLEDLREGDYVVGRKERRTSRPTPRSNARDSQLSTSGSSTRHFGSVDGRSTPTSTSAIPLSPTSSRWSASSSPTHPAGQPMATASHGSVARDNKGLGLVGSSPLTLNFPGPPELSSESGTWTRTSDTTFGSVPTSTEDRRTTIAALWKAEYNQLVKTYGRDRADRSIAALDRESFHHAAAAEPPSATYQATLALEPLPHPAIDGKKVEDFGRVGNISYPSTSQHDDRSDNSSHKRLSSVSSCARSSSYSTNTSAGENEADHGREDIRRLVDKMRTTYLHAIEAGAPPPSHRKQTRQKSRPQLVFSPTGPATEASISSPGFCDDRLAWPGAGSDTHSCSGKRRGAAHSAARVGTLSPIEASPSKHEPVHGRGLERADSTTLGHLTGQPSGSASARGASSATDTNVTCQGEPSPGHAAVRRPDRHLDTDEARRPPAPPRYQLGLLHMDLEPSTTTLGVDLDEMYADIFGPLRTGAGIDAGPLPTATATPPPSTS